jgi:hypothetical protein
LCRPRCPPAASPRAPAAVSAQRGRAARAGRGRRRLQKRGEERPAWAARCDRAACGLPRRPSMTRAAGTARRAPRRRARRPRWRASRCLSRGSPGRSLPRRKQGSSTSRRRQAGRQGSSTSRRRQAHLHDFPVGASTPRARLCPRGRGGTVHDTLVVRTGAVRVRVREAVRRCDPLRHLLAAHGRGGEARERDGDGAAREALVREIRQDLQPCRPAGRCQRPRRAARSAQRAASGGNSCLLSERVAHAGGGRRGKGLGVAPTLPPETLSTSGASFSAVVLICAHAAPPA